jgi:hypothetical protein
MRFRAKIVPETWLWLLICGINAAMAFDRLFHPRQSEVGFLNLITAILALLVFYGQKTTTWEMDTDSLRQRKLWINTKIGWQDVTRVESLWSSFYDLKIAYNRRGIGSRIGHILANPVDRDAFLDSLHRFAPQAEFVDKSNKKILNI